MRQLGALFAVLGAAVTLGGTRSAASVPPQRPNILFLFSDDHAYQALSAYGSKLNRTPNLDRIAKEGMQGDSIVAYWHPSAASASARFAL